MNDREQFEAWCESTNPHYKKTDDSVIDRAAWKIWHACAESKQAELDKANARIVQLEDALNNLESDGWISPMLYRDTIAPSQQAALNAISNQPDTWLSEHDKAVEVKVLEEVNLKLCNHDDPFNILIDMIESRK